MKPIEFVHYDGGSLPNGTVRSFYEAMQKDIIIRGSKHEFEVLSYYMWNGRMVLDIQKKGK